MSLVLLVEDSAVQRRAISSWLQSDSRQVDVAENGQQAIDYLLRQRPDVIVSDIEMPDMSGLELVREIQLQYPDIPVVLITAHGTEDLAVEALRAGAASYVPKDDVRHLLPETIDALMARVSSERTYEQLIECATRAVFDFQLDNDPELVRPLVDLLQQMIGNISRLDENERLRVGVAITQAVHNAMFRGNLEIPGPAAVSAGAPVIAAESRRDVSPYRERRIDVHTEITADEVTITVRDGGNGFDFIATQQAEQQEGFVSGVGRGLVLMHAFMDEVKYNDRGNEVLLRKRAAPAADSTEAPAAEVADQRPAQPKRQRMKPLATLTPLEPGPTVELRKSRVVVGRDRTSDVVIPFPDVSAHHCQLFLFGGWWYVKDLNTKNGVRINGTQVTRRRVNPGDVLHVAKHRFELQYDPGELGAVGVTPPPDPF